MPEIKFNSGVQTFMLNDAVEVSFNPTDIIFAERVIGMIDEIDTIQTAYSDKYKDSDQYEAMLNDAHELDNTIRAKLDGLFGVPVCAPLFGETSVYAAADGLPLWCNLLLAVIDTMDASVIAEKKATNPRIQKYTAKYKR